MRLGLTLVVVAAAIAAAASNEAFASWARTYGFDATNATIRQKFDAASLRIAALNAKHKGKATFAPNQFALLSEDEWHDRMTGTYIGGSPNTNPNPVFFSHAQVETALQASVDWQLSGPVRAVTRVRNQGNCGSCWAFATVAALEGAYAISGGNPLTAFSEQYILDCVSSPYLLGCGGGSISALAELLTNVELPYAAMYPYIAYDGATETCNNTVSGVASPSSAVTAGQQFDQSVEDVMAAFLNLNGPLAVAVRAESAEWQHYSSGVLECLYEPSSQRPVNHGVAIVGYGTELDGTPYWKVKNSWSPGWGELGYVKLLRGANTCGVATTNVGFSFSQ